MENIVSVQAPFYIIYNKIIFIIKFYTLNYKFIFLSNFFIVWNRNKNISKLLFKKIYELKFKK